MGDGAGILIQIPTSSSAPRWPSRAWTLPPPGEYGVGMIFLPKEHASRLACEQELERAVKAEGQVLLGWRDVPVDRDMPMSPTVRAKEPVIRQIFIGRGADVIVPDALERKLYVIRKTASAAIQKLKLTHSREYYVPSMSCRTIIYKGLLLADQVGVYYKDLQDRAWSRPWRWCTSASRPTPSPSGRWPTPTGWWRTTARSTPSRATSTGCAPAKA
jgi:glutamate synthase (NADPH/NADH) large chain